MTDTARTAHTFSIGFTGTQEGMTGDQLTKLCEALAELSIHPGYAEHLFVFRHGVCEGADEGFHWAVHKMLNRNRFKIIGYPGTDATGASPKRGQIDCDEWQVERPYLIRNKLIVRDSDVLWAAPKEKHDELRSGTWSTVRYANRTDVPVQIFYPDGTIGS